MPKTVREYAKEIHDKVDELNNLVERVIGEHFDVTVHMHMVEHESIERRAAHKYRLGYPVIDVQVTQEF